ncbi:hypothetical protein GMOD_00008795 [Pyrenophora seminiperda CCB06]|uniref:Uncharacterized protein n=1 Tax=Pyrenophora seminiperda CCB06 TaxID=1302712 RepID=A0A3M7M5V3_9PLEO|nr:hypothetical protein GMOD_00008795 [Pyrenophora seminiperda CCB06]
MWPIQEIIASGSFAIGDDIMSWVLVVTSSLLRTLFQDDANIIILYDGYGSLISIRSPIRQSHLLQTPRTFLYQKPRARIPYTSYPTLRGHRGIDAIAVR